MVLVLRLATSLVLAAAAAVFPMPECLDFPCDPQVNAQLNSSGFGRLFLAPWYRWDTAHYLDLADPGTQIFGLENTVWPPLYPLLIRVVSSVMPGMAAALLISTTACLAAFYLLYREVSTRWDDQTARRTITLLAVFPTGFFLVAGYSEALFLALSVAVFTELRRKRWLMAGVWGALATLTRLLGIFLLLPLAWEGFVLLRAAYQAREQGRPLLKLFGATLKDRSTMALFGAAVLIPLALAFHFSVSHFIKGALWPWQTFSVHWGHHLELPGLGVWNDLLFILQNEFMLIKISMFFDVVLLMVLMVMLVVKRKDLPISYVLYGAVMLVFPIHVSFG